MKQKNLYEMGMTLLLKNVKSFLATFDEESGRFLADNGGWAVTQQDHMLSLAYLYTTPYENHPYYQNKELLDIIIKAGDALRDFQYDDGKVEFVKIDGSQWGPIYMPWSMYHWLETYALLQDHLPRETLEKWKEGLVLAHEGINEELKTSPVHNIPVWYAMSLNRAQQLFDKPQWKETADWMIQRALDDQTDCGYWKEHHGPTTRYNEVYIHALGLYHFHGGDIDVLGALDKGFQFHDVFTYPDGTCVETIDGRVNYHNKIYPIGMLGLYATHKGKGLVKFLLEKALKRKEDFFMPHLTTFLMHIKPNDAVEYRQQLLVGQKKFQIKYGKAWITKKPHWYVCMSGYVTPKVEERWGQDRQSFLGVWNQKTGLLIGGGNSKDQPLWSTFVVGDQYLPDGATIKEENKVIEYHYGKDTCRLSLKESKKDEVKIGYSYESNGQHPCVMHIPLKWVEEDAFLLDQTPYVLDKEIKHKGKQGAHTLSYKGVTLSFEGKYTLEWPSFPFNPYAKDGKAPNDEEVAILSLFPNEKEQYLVLKEEA